ncbi:MAG: LlaJI family restriction endonuclease [Bacillota bacterium]|nr:LlaJI family restriction endonuclease [Bacillota bacterium]MDW7670944.1 LlaJI family restriction endonuclease [Bacillota bacterium]
MDIPFKLLERCHVNKNSDGDHFVGIKADSDNAMVYFPIGYKLPKTEKDLRQDILHLISVISGFTNRDDRVLATQKFAAPKFVDFPINTYMEIINYFMEQNGYYTEKEPKYKIGDSGKVDWEKTIRRQRPLISNGSPIYTNCTVRYSSPNDKNMITQIHKFCVYESFTKLGWLFTPYLPERPTIPRNDKMFLSVLRRKLANTYNDKDKRIFLSMIAMIEFMESSENQFYFGTDRFEYVWEKIIDRTFGIKEKKNYFPKTEWNLRTGKKSVNAALEPDTIMLHNGKIYVLDAKYYRFGITGNPKHLPESSSINKQITYGEYIHNQRFNGKTGDDVPVYNAFIMPYNAEDNPIDFSDIIANIGEATAKWKTVRNKYERVQGIVIDIRFLMFHYVGKPKDQIMRLAQSIESAFEVSGGHLPTDAASVVV